MWCSWWMDGWMNYGGNVRQNIATHSTLGHDSTLFIPQDVQHFHPHSWIMHSLQIDTTYQSVGVSGNTRLIVFYSYIRYQSPCHSFINQLGPNQHFPFPLPFRPVHSNALSKSAVSSSSTMVKTLASSLSLSTLLTTAVPLLTDLQLVSSVKHMLSVAWLWLPWLSRTCPVLLVPPLSRSISKRTRPSLPGTRPHGLRSSPTVHRERTWATLIVSSFWSSRTRCVGIGGFWEICVHCLTFLLIV